MYVKNPEKNSSDDYAELLSLLLKMGFNLSIIKLQDSAIKAQAKEIKGKDNVIKLQDKLIKEKR